MQYADDAYTTVFAGGKQWLILHHEGDLLEAS